MSAAATAIVPVENPFPGLVSFKPEQSKYFYGRNKQIEELLKHLERHRFLAVIGSSGCGKSSLVRAGLLPALYRGYLSRGPNWSIAVMKPGSRPIKALSDALRNPDCLGPAAEFDPDALLDTTRALVVVSQRHLLPAQNLLIVVDQFEEIFRFRRESEAADAEASHFVELLLHAASCIELPIHVVLTMRTDYFTDCAQFDGLPEAMNQGQFLVPRLLREQRQEAIEGPLIAVGVQFTGRLVQQVLNDFGDDPNNLPVLQHALRRTFEQWYAKIVSESEDPGKIPIAISHYNEASKKEGAIEQHCEETFEQLSPVHRILAEKIFRSLTTVDRGRRVRRPRHVALINEIVGNSGDVENVINHFIREGFLIKGSDDVVDVTHESLITRWARLKAWVDREELSAKWYVHLANAAAERLSPWRGRELNEALEYRRADRWSEAWALQYGPGYAEATRFLDRSSWLRIVRVFSGISILALIVVGATLFIYRLNQEKRRAEKESFRAEQQAKRAEAAELEAKSARDEAKSEARRAQAAVVGNDTDRQRLLKEAETYRSTASSFRRQVALATGKPVPPPPIVEPKPVAAQTGVPQAPVTDPGPNRDVHQAPIHEAGAQRFLLGAYSLQPIKGLENRAAVFIGELPTAQKPELIYVALSRVVDVPVPAFRDATTDKSVVKELINTAEGRPNANFPSLLFTSFPISRDAHLGNGLELGGFSVRSIGAKYIVILKEYKQNGGTEKVSLELKKD